MQSVKRWLERVSLRGFPAILTILMVFFAAAVGHIPGMSHVMPLLVLINIYYWCMFYPGTLPYWFLFLLGLLQDTLSGVQIGFSSFVNVLVAFVIIRKLRVFSTMSFAVIWLRFVELALGTVALMWFMAVLFQPQARFAPISYQILQWFSSCLAYPLLHYFLTTLYRSDD